MGGLSKPNWCLYVGGPHDGVRIIVFGADRVGETTAVHVAAGPGMVTPHEYLITGEYRKGTGVNEGRSRVLRYVRALPEMPVGPPAEFSNPSPMASPDFWRPRE